MFWAGLLSNPIAWSPVLVHWGPHPFHGPVSGKALRLLFHLTNMSSIFSWAHAHGHTIPGNLAVSPPYV